MARSASNEANDSPREDRVTSPNMRRQALFLEQVRLRAAAAIQAGPMTPDDSSEDEVISNAASGWSSGPSPDLDIIRLPLQAELNRGRTQPYDDDFFPRHARGFLRKLLLWDQLERTPGMTPEWKSIMEQCMNHLYVDRATCSALLATASSVQWSRKCLLKHWEGHCRDENLFERHLLLMEYLFGDAPEPQWRVTFEGPISLQSTQEGVRAGFLTWWSERAMQWADGGPPITRRPLPNEYTLHEVHLQEVSFLTQGIRWETRQLHTSATDPLRLPLHTVGPMRGDVVQLWRLPSGQERYNGTIGRMLRRRKCTGHILVKLIRLDDLVLTPSHTVLLLARRDVHCPLGQTLRCERPADDAPALVTRMRLPSLSGGTTEE